MQSDRIFWATDPIEGTWTLYNQALWWDGPQKSDRWKALKSHRAGTSTILGLAYGNKFGKKEVSVQTYIDQLLGEKEVEINPKMQKGIDEEHLIRARHLAELRKISPDTRIEEVGLVIPLRYPWLNSSPDGLVYDPSEPDPIGIAEYKRTTEMYRPLLPKSHPRWYRRYPDHTLAKNPTQLWTSHYAQLQHHLFLSGCSWGDYCVMADPDTNYNWVQLRIRKNPTFWLVLIKQATQNLDPYQDRIFAKMVMPPKLPPPTGWDMALEDDSDEDY